MGSSQLRMKKCQSAEKGSKRSQRIEVWEEAGKELGRSAVAMGAGPEWPAQQTS